MTSKTRKLHVSPALVISLVALFMTLGGTAFAVGVAKNSVRSPQIADGTVRSVDLRDNSVNAPKLAPDAVGNEEIAENAVASAEVAPDSLTNQDLGAASVASSEVADNSLSADDLGPDSAGQSEIAADSVHASELAAIAQVSNSTTIKAGENASVNVACPAGTTVISGGARNGLYSVHLTSVYRSGNGWHTDAHSNSGSDTTLTVYAYCLAG